MSKTTDDPHSEVNKEAARRLRGDTPIPTPTIPTITDKRCPNLGCGQFMLSDGFCPRCQPRVIAPGPELDGQPPPPKRRDE